MVVAGGKSKRLLDAQGVAEEFGVARATVRNWKSDGLPFRRDGRIQLGVVEAWLEARKEKKRARAADRVGDPDRPARRATLDEVRLRYEAARAEKAEIELAALKGEYVRVEDLFGLLVDRVRELRSGFDSILARVPAYFPEIAIELEAKMAAEFERLLSKYSRPDTVTRGAASKKRASKKKATKKKSAKKPAEKKAARRRVKK